MNVPELLKSYHMETDLHSLPGPMRNTPSYKAIMVIGERALPYILTHLKEENGGMNVMLLLTDITHEQPEYNPEPIGDTKIAKYDVSAYREAWLQWGRTKKLID